MQFTPFSCHPISFRFKYPPQHPVFKHPQSIYIYTTLWKLRAVCCFLFNGYCRLNSCKISLCSSTTFESGWWNRTSCMLFLQRLIPTDCCPNICGVYFQTIPIIALNLKFLYLTLISEGLLTISENYLQQYHDFWKTTIFFTMFRVLMFLTPCSRTTFTKWDDIKHKNVYLFTLRPHCTGRQKSSVHGYGSVDEHSSSSSDLTSLAVILCLVLSLDPCSSA
jgi:hypothetical protein